MKYHNQILLIVLLVLQWGAPWGHSYSLQLECGSGGILKSFQFTNLPIASIPEVNYFNSNVTFCEMDQKPTLPIDVFKSLLEQSTRGLDLLQKKSDQSDVKNWKMDELISSLKKALQATGEKNQMINQEKGTITLFPQTNTRTRNRASRNYKIEQLQNVIRASLRAEVDPYLALAISILESPSLIKMPEGPLKVKATDYELRYGLIPIDAIGAIDLLGCQIKKFKLEKNLLEKLKRVSVLNKLSKEIDIGSEEYSKLEDALKKAGVPSECLWNSNACKGSLQAGPKKEFILDGAASDAEKQFCISDLTPVVTAGSPELTTNHESGCCAKIRYSSKKYETFPVDQVDFFLARDFKTQLGAMFIQKTIQREIANKPLNNKNLSWFLQAYNGRGKIGSTEPISSKCLEGINTGDKPVYGTAVGNIMLNMLMVNPLVQTLVNEERDRLKSPVKNILCLQKGPGTHFIDPLVFSKEESTYLFEPPKRRKFCSRDTLKPSIPITNTPWNSIEEMQAALGL